MCGKDIYAKHMFYLELGITPACAGKTESSSSSSRIKQDHPRMCGKDIIPTYPLRGVKGSPPHVRERPTGKGSEDMGFGITPACAGKTFLICSVIIQHQDHPRMCGKDFFSGSRFLRRLGSPPHVRERRCNYSKCIKRCRITPACAGKTSLMAESIREVRDHPRMCGKDVTLNVVTIHLLGSPPHVRERRMSFSLFSRSVRITPACAGKTDFERG